jgi:hypothetical protein
MTRSRTALAIVACLAFIASQTLDADVRYDHRSKFQFAGAMGRVVNFFGGKAAREGVTTTTAIKGNRMLTMGDSTGEIIDLGEEKLYALDVKKKTYRVTTFAEMRRQMEEARKRAAEEARKEQPPQQQQEPAAQDPNAKQVEVDFDVKNTGERKEISGFAATQSVMTITVREKGKTLQQSGGVVMTSDMWMTPTIPALKEIADFNLRYAEQLYGPMVTGASPEEMASVMALYPMMKPALDKMATEGKKLQGTAVLTTSTFDAVKSAEQMAAEQSSASDARSSGGSTPTGVGGLLGGLGKRMARRNNDQAAAGPKDRATFLTTTFEILKVTPSVTDADVAIPAGFKESK